MTGDDQRGCCPRCGRPGSARQPCSDDACIRLGVHRLPAPYVDAPSDDPAIGRIFGKWLVCARLGEGAVGAVYLAEQQPVRVMGALKLVSRSGGPMAQEERFVREAKALALLQHPNIVRLLDFGVARDRPYLVMEYLNGGRTLRDALPDMTLVERRSVLVQITHALEEAHGHGVVHRDLKPDNIMIQAVAGQPHFVRLVDFGLAKFTYDGAESTIAAGSPRYMAPEQATQQALGPWTDVYAVGVMACEMLADHRPFGGGTVQAILFRKTDPDHDPLQDATRPVPDGLAGFLRRAMALDPQGRFPDAAAMRAALPPVEALAIDDGLGATALLGETAALEATAPSSEAAVDEAADRRPGAARWPIWTAVGLAAAGGLLAVSLTHAPGPTGALDGGPDGRTITTAPPPAPAPDVAPSAPDAVAIDAAAVDAAPPPPDAAPPDAAPPDARPDAGAVRATTARRDDARRPRPAAEPDRPPASPPVPPSGRGIGNGLQMHENWTKEKTP